jgi:hypothetical protein
MIGAIRSAAIFSSFVASAVIISRVCIGRLGALPVRQAIGEGPLRLAADRRWRHDADAGPVGTADRGDGLAPDGSTAADSPTNADLTEERFTSDSGPVNAGLVSLSMSLAEADLPSDPAALRAFALACHTERAGPATPMRFSVSDRWSGIRPSTNSILLRFSAIRILSPQKQP